MRYDELIDACIKCIQNFNPKIEGPDSFADKYLKKVSSFNSNFRQQKIQMNECLLSKFFMEFYVVKNF